MITKHGALTVQFDKYNEGIAVKPIKMIMRILKSKGEALKDGILLSKRKSAILINSYDEGVKVNPNWIHDENSS